MNDKIDGGCRPAQILKNEPGDLQPVAAKRQLAPGVTRSYRAAVMYIASQRCWCATQPELCTPCVARMTVSRVTHSPDPAIVKCCGRCKAFKRGDQFYADDRYADGLATMCCSCTRKDGKSRRAA